MKRVSQILRVICSSLRGALWIAVVLVIGGLLAYFEVSGLANIFPMPIAVSIAFIVMVMLGLFSHRAKRTGCRASFSLAFVLLLVTAFQFGLSFNEHLKHEGGKRAQGIEANSEVNAIDEQWQTAKDELKALVEDLDALGADIAGLEAVEDRGTRIDAEIESLTGEIYTINNDGKPETAADKNAIRVMENRIAFLRDEKSTTALPTREELAGKRAKWLAAQGRVKQAEADVAKLATERMSLQANAYQLEETQHAFLSLASRIAESDNDKASLILIAGGFFWGLAIQGSFCWLCTMGVAGRQNKESASIGIAGTKAKTGKSSRTSKTKKPKPAKSAAVAIAGKVISPQFRKPKPPKQRQHRVVPELPAGNGNLHADQVRSLTRKLNKERLLDRAYTSRELDRIPIPERRQMCLAVMGEEKADRIVIEAC